MSLRFEDLGVVPEHPRWIWAAVDTDTDRVVGAFAFDVSDPENPVWTGNYVIPEMRGQGIYHAMLAAFMDEHEAMPPHCNLINDGWLDHVNLLTSPAPGTMPSRLRDANGEAIGRLLISDAERLRASTRQPE